MINMPSEKSTRRYRVHSQYDPHGLLRRGRKLNASYASLGLPTTPNSISVPHSVPEEGTARSPGRVRSRAKWASECLKLLEAMLELDDSEPFRQPLHPRKYPEFYNKIDDAIDLSKVMIKFHSGQYRTPDDFTQDINKMFEDYKKIFVDTQSQIYSQVHRLSWWFESEATRILEDWRGKVKKMVNRVNSQSTESSLRVTDQHSPTSQAYWPPPSSSSQPQITSQNIGLEPMVANKGEDSTNIILSIKHGMCTIVQQQSQQDEHDKGDGTEVMLPNVIRTTPTSSVHHMPKTAAQRPPTATASLREQRTSTTAAALRESLAKSHRLPTTSPASAHKPVTSSSVVSKVVQRPRLHIPTTKQKESTRTPSTASQKKAAAKPVQIILDVSTIWCGACKFKPLKPLVLSETGLQFILQKDNQDVPFFIKPADIVRCLGHFERTRRHTLFLCLLPGSCRRFSQIFGERSITSSLMAMFLPASTANSIANIIHVFWNMSKTSVFGQLFSEIDSQTALDLLAQIRPAILNKLGDDIRPGHGASRSHQSEPAPKPAVTTSTSDTVLETSREASMALDLSGVGGETGLISGGGGLPEARPSISMPNLSSPAPVVSPAQVASPAPAVAESVYQAGEMTAVTDLTSSPPETVADDDADRDDSDLEIVVPSDDEDNISEIKTEFEDLGDLMVMSEKLSIKCPITQQVMQRPVKNKHCGHCYDRQGVEEIIKFRGEKARCPVPGCSNSEPLHNKDLLYDYELWKKIQSELDPSWMP